MKALNRAIARTVSQLARYGGDEFHPLMKHALVQHLSMLLAMERKQLEQVPGKLVAFSTPQEKGRTAWERYLDSGIVSDDLIRGLGLKCEDGPELAVPTERAGRAFEHPVPVEPGLHIDVGDVLTRTNATPGSWWTFGRDYEVISTFGGVDVTVLDDEGKPRLISVEYARRNFSVGKKQVEPAEQTAPAPDAKPADEAPAPAYQVGDMLEYAGESAEYFTKGKLYPVSAVSTSRQYPVYIIDDEGDEHGLRKCLPEFINRGQPAAQPAPDAIDMTDPRNWQAGDVVLRGPKWGFFSFSPNKEYTVVSNDGKSLGILGEHDTIVSYHFDKYSEPASNYFTWLRHGEAQE